MAVAKVKQETNWRQIIFDLERQGYSPSMISAEIQIARTTILGWKNSDLRPGYEHGFRLVQLWCDLTGNIPTDRPRHLR